MSESVTLTNNTGTFTLGHQINTIELSTNKTYVNSDIRLDINVTTAVLTSTSPTNTFDIVIPNGNSTTITLNFSVDSNGNVLVT